MRIARQQLEQIIRECIRGLLVEQTHDEAGQIVRLVIAGHSDQAIELLKALPEIDLAAVIDALWAHAEELSVRFDDLYAAARKEYKDSMEDTYQTKAWKTTWQAQRDLKNFMTSFFKFVKEPKDTWADWEDFIIPKPGEMRDLRARKRGLENLQLKLGRSATWSQAKGWRRLQFKLGETAP